MAITKVRFLRVSWGCELAQLTVVARKGGLSLRVPSAETPLRLLRGGVLLLDTRLPVAETWTAVQVADILRR